MALRWLAIPIVGLAFLAAPSAYAVELTRDGTTVVFSEPEADLSQNSVFVGVFSASPNHLIWDANEAITDGYGASCCMKIGCGHWDCGQSPFLIVLGRGDVQLHDVDGASYTVAAVSLEVNFSPGIYSITGGDG